jgi:fumarate reductase subunit C
MLAVAVEFQPEHLLKPAVCVLLSLVALVAFLYHTQKSELSSSATKQRLNDNDKFVRRSTRWAVTAFLSEL